MAKAKAKKEKVTIGKAVPTGFDVAKKAIIKKYGNVISTLGDADTEIKTVSTGLLGPDLALGRGGIAKGRILECYGPPSGGKTTFAMRMIAQAQRQGEKCVFVDAERAADPQLFESMGVNIDDLIYIRAFSGEENLDALETVLKSGTIGLAVVDSITALIPKDELDEEISKNFMALLARLMSKALRRFVPLVGATNTTLLFINQIRQDLSKWGDSEVTTGGDAINFYSTYRIRVSGGDTLKSRIIGDDGEVMGHTTTFKMVKNKLSAPFRKAEVNLIYGVGYDVYSELLTFAEDFGIIEKVGAWYSYDGKKLGQGSLNAKKALEEDKDLYDEIRALVIDISGLKEHYDKQGIK